MNTRLNPTTHAGPTLGHVYCALVNEHAAHTTGGKFMLRASNAQADWIALGYSIEQMTGTAEQWMALFDWLEIRVDKFVLETDAEDECEHAIRRILPAYMPETAFEPVDYPNNNDELYPDAHWFTAATVWWDHRDGVNYLIAGNDLLSRFSAYRLIERMFCYRKFPHVYLPRLVDEDGMIRKKFGKWKLNVLKADGWTPREIRETLALSCLYDPLGEWDIANVLPQPRLAMGMTA